MLDLYKNEILKTYIFTLMIASLFFNSCSNKPGINDVEETLQNQINNESEERIELINIEKTNSIDNEFMGQKVHTIEFKAKIKFLEDCMMYVNKSGMGPYFMNFKTYTKEPDFNPSMMKQIVTCAKDVEVEYFGSATYSETEKGWILTK